MPKRSALAIRHVAFEDLGSLAGPLRQAGYEIEYCDAAGPDPGSVNPLAADLLIVLGGPIGVRDGDSYPVVRTERDILKARLDADMPTLGICLGAQLMASALGSRVYPGPCKEIGWAPLALTGEGLSSPLRALDGLSVLHWHGDTFDLPEGCRLLGSTEICRNQAFARGPRILGLQFHPEVMAGGFEHWLLGHAFELAAAKLDPNELRADADRHGRSLEAAATDLFTLWLDGLG